MKVIDNLFDDQTISDLVHSVDIHFDCNLLSSDFIEITNSIVDCHGLALSNTAYFPYSERCWNILCLKIKREVDKYCMVDPHIVTPFSCWAERSLNICAPLPKEEIGMDTSVWDEPDYTYDYDGQVKKTFIRSVYKLTGSLGVKFEDEVIELKKNSLIIYNGTENKSANIYPSQKGECNIIFDWYLNDPYDVPDWILPIT